LIAHYIHLLCLPINSAGQLACGLGLGLAGILVVEEVVALAGEEVELAAEVEEAAVDFRSLAAHPGAKVGVSPRQWPTRTQGIHKPHADHMRP